MFLSSDVDPQTRQTNKMITPQAAIEAASAVGGVLAIVGVLLNNGRYRVCFMVWIVSNTIAAGAHLSTSPPMWSMAGKDLVFLGLAVAGWIQWGRPRPTANSQQPTANIQLDDHGGEREGR